MSGTFFPWERHHKRSRGTRSWPSYSSILRAEDFPIVRSKAERAFLRRVLLFSLLGGCFTSLASLAVIVASALSGPFLLPPIGEMIRLLLVIFGISCVLVAMGLIFSGFFLRP